MACARTSLLDARPGLWFIFEFEAFTVQPLSIHSTEYSNSPPALHAIDALKKSAPNRLGNPQSPFR